MKESCASATINLGEDAVCSGRISSLMGGQRPVLTLDGPGAVWNIWFPNAEKLDEAIAVMQEMREKIRE